ncbi:hypothetical protein A4R26_31035 [Niastella populi]|uniref:Helix-turn-helix domain-containing protein n=1 Tax=Niastella populi TaxID=550983 RepID=A0A1V9ESL5_9BACT|nr:hypothetical protein A4R26_31035 [Niastella populi]
MKESVKEVISSELKEYLTTPTSIGPDTSQEFLTRRQVANLLQVSLPTLHAYTKQGLIKAIRFGRQVRYLKTDIGAALKEIRSLNYKK